MNPGFPKKAFLLAAGLGTRLRSLMGPIPKCLVPIGGQPLLGLWLKFLRKWKVEEVLINLHYQADQVKNFLSSEPHPGLNIHLVHEPRLLGSAGTLAQNRSFVENDPSFWVFYADNLAAVDLRPMVELMERHHPSLVMGLFRPRRVREASSVEIDAHGKVLSFEEKPAHPKSPLSNAGLYLFSTAFWPPLPTAPFDIGKDVLPRLVNDMYAVELPGYLKDIGLPEEYQQAQTDWKQQALEEQFS